MQEKNLWKRCRKELAVLGALSVISAAAAYYVRKTADPVYNAPAIEYRVKHGDTIEGCSRGEGYKSRDQIKIFENVFSDMNRERVIGPIKDVGYRHVVSPDGKLYVNTTVGVPDANRNGKACQ